MKASERGSTVDSDAEGKPSSDAQASSAQASGMSASGALAWEACCSAPPPLWRKPATGAALLACAASAAAAFLPPLPFWLSATLVIGVALPLLLAVLWEWSRTLPSRPAAALVVASAGLVWTLTAFSTRAGGPWYLLHPLNSVALVAATLALGSWLARELERPGHLLPVCVMGALADLWSVLAGPTRRIGEQTAAHLEQASAELSRGGSPPPPPWPSFLVFHWPQPGGGGMASLWGFGDLVFLALLLGGARRFGLPARRTLALLGAGLTLSLGLSLAWQRPVPALPLICGLFVLGHLPALRLTRREWWITALATLGLGAAVAAAALRGL